MHKRLSGGLVTIIFLLLITAHPPASVQILMHSGVREAWIGAETGRLTSPVKRDKTGFNTLSHPPAVCKLPGPALPPPPEEVFSWG
ncbi:MAG: hypothetical protein ACREDJ_00175 [Methylocella sp.]